MRRLGAYAQPAIVADVDALQLNRPSRNDYPCARICGDGTFGHQKVRVGGSDAELAAVLKRDPAEENSGRTGNDNALGPGKRDWSSEGDIFRVRNVQDLRAGRRYLNGDRRSGKEAQVIAVLDNNRCFGAIAGEGKAGVVR